MPFTQEERKLRIYTPLGDNAFHVSKFAYAEAISGLFSGVADVVADNSTQVAFHDLLGQAIALEVELEGGGYRYFHGIVHRASLGRRGEEFTRYQIEMAPRLWLLTRRQQSRIFQQLPVPDILRKVLEGIDTAYEIQGTFEPRDYCVQYRETDFAFFSRLMEEEGIFYFFRHSRTGHQLVLANTPQSHEELPNTATLIYEEQFGGMRDEARIMEWRKRQELRSGKVTLWDHCFELPHKHLEASRTVLNEIQVGRGTLKLQVGGNNALELYDYPGAYAQRFDGIAPGGGERASDIQKIFQDNVRTASIRIEQETLPAVHIEGECNYFSPVAGFKFTLDRHPTDNGAYVVTSTRYEMKQTEDPMSRAVAETEAFEGNCHFSCIPATLPFRPFRTTPKPFIPGTQTAVVSGPAGEEIFTDKYGRVKVQFHWDREGKNDANSACWCRVASFWAGKLWGAIHIPRIGHEVVVAFEEGDPDRPIIIGSVYNADHMPPWTLPDNRTQSGIKSRTTPSSGNDKMNVIRFEDKSGQEQIFIHAQKNMDLRVKEDRYETIERDHHLTVQRDVFENFKNHVHTKVAQNVTEEIGADLNLKIKGKEAVEVSSDISEKAGGNVAQKTGGNHTIDVGGNLTLKAGGNITIQAGGMFSVSASGPLILKGSAVASLEGASMLILNGAMVQIATAPGLPALPAIPAIIVPPAPPQNAAEAIKADQSDQNRYTGEGYQYQAEPLPPYTPPQITEKTGGPPAQQPGREEEEERTHFIEIKLQDAEGNPVPGERYRVVTPDNRVVTGTLNAEGYARIDGLKPGQCQVTFPALDETVTEPR